MSGILKAVRDHIHLRTQSDGRKPASIAIHPDLLVRFQDAVDLYMEAESMATRRLSMEKRIQKQQPEDTICFMAVDFFPDPNGIKAF